MYLHAPTIIPAKKPLLDLYGDFVQPFLGTICPVHLIPNVCLQGLYAVFSCFELTRQLLSEVQRLLVVFLSRAGCAVNQAQDRLPAASSGSATLEATFLSSRQKEQRPPTREEQDYSLHPTPLTILSYGN